MQIDKIYTLVTGVIKRGDKYLLLRRNQESTFGGTWQFPEGKIEEKETPFNALDREIKEELGLKLSESNFLNILIKEFKANGGSMLGVKLIFSVSVGKQKIKLSEDHEDFGWFTKTETMKLDLTPGTEEVLTKV